MAFLSPSPFLPRCLAFPFSPSARSAAREASRFFPAGRRRRERKTRSGISSSSCSTARVRLPLIPSSPFFISPSLELTCDTAPIEAPIPPTAESRTATKGRRDGSVNKAPGKHRQRRETSALNERPACLGLRNARRHRKTPESSRRGCTRNRTCACACACACARRADRELGIFASADPRRGSAARDPISHLSLIASIALGLPSAGIYSDFIWRGFT
jgi:hypothetical protein